MENLENLIPQCKEYFSQTAANESGNLHAMDWKQRLKDELKHLGWGPADLHRAVQGISLDSAKKYAKGLVEQPRGNTLKNIAAGMGFEYQWFLHGTEPKYINGRSPHSPKGTTQPGAPASGKKSPIIGKRCSDEEREAQEEGSVEDMKMRIMSDIMSLLVGAPAEVYLEVRDFARFKVEQARSDETGAANTPTHPQ